MGELDDIRPYITSGRKMRYEYYELFDAGNVDEEGKVIDPNSPKAQYQKVCRLDRSCHRTTMWLTGM